jgi:hypothetical protein
VKGAVAVKLIRENDRERVFLVRETSGFAEPRGEEVTGTIGQVAEEGCWYPTRDAAESAAKRWKLMQKPQR